jgi:hypothetical protein
MSSMEEGEWCDARRLFVRNPCWLRSDDSLAKNGKSRSGTGGDFIHSPFFHLDSAGGCCESDSGSGVPTAPVTLFGLLHPLRSCAAPKMGCISTVL